MKSIVVLIFTDLLDHGEDMVEVTEVGAAVGEEMATAVVARWPAAKEVVVDFEDEEDVEAVVHLTEKLTLFCLLQNFSTPSPPKKPKPHEPSLDARSLFLYVRFAADVIWRKKNREKQKSWNQKFAEPEIEYPQTCCITHIDCG